MLINIKTLTGKTTPIELESSSTITEVKRVIAEKEGPAPAEQKLVYKGKILENSTVLSDFGVEGEITIYLVLRLRS